jgi:hypothetical protein
MDSVDDPSEGGVAAAAINTVQVISGAFGAGVAGVVVNTAENRTASVPSGLSDLSDAVAARWLFAVFAVVGALGVVASYRASNGATRGGR